VFLIVSLFQLRSLGLLSIRWCDLLVFQYSYQSLLFYGIIDKLLSRFLDLFLKSSFVCFSESRDVLCWGCNANSTTASEKVVDETLTKSNYKHLKLRLNPLLWIWQQRKVELAEDCKDSSDIFHIPKKLGLRTQCENTVLRINKLISHLHFYLKSWNDACNIL